MLDLTTEADAKAPQKLGAIAAQNPNFTGLQDKALYSVLSNQNSSTSVRNSVLSHPAPCFTAESQQEHTPVVLEMYNILVSDSNLFSAS